MSKLGDILRTLHLLQPILRNGEEGNVEIQELQDVDERSEEKLKRAEDNLGPFRRGEITEATFYERVLGLGGDNGED